MSEQLAKIVTDQKERGANYSLLLKQVQALPYDETAKNFLAHTLANPGFCEVLCTSEILMLAEICQMHGLITESIDLLEKVHRGAPENREAWEKHFSLLLTLGRNEAVSALLARLAGCHAGEFVEQMRAQVITEPAIQRDQNWDVDEPFVRMRREEYDIDIFSTIFKGRKSAFARQWVDRERSKAGYVPIKKKMTGEDIRDHIAGRKTYGIYLMNEDNTVNLGVIDIDLNGPLRNSKARVAEKAQIKRETAYLFKIIRQRAKEANIELLFEVSGNKGFHIWLPVQNPVHSSLMRKTLQLLIDGLSEDCNCYSLELFPKQDKLTGKGFGNLVKLPLGVHQLSGRRSHFLVPGQKGQSLKQQEQMEFLRKIRPTPESSLEKHVQMSGKSKMAIFPGTAKRVKSTVPSVGKYSQGFTELVTRCKMIGQITARLENAGQLSVREEKVLLGVLRFMPDCQYQLHQLFGCLPEYNRGLVDYKISMVRGTVLGCKRIHRLLGLSDQDLPCVHKGGRYAHPLLHLGLFSDDDPHPVCEKVENLSDALNQLKLAVQQVEKFIMV